MLTVDRCRLSGSGRVASSECRSLSFDRYVETGRDPLVERSGNRSAAIEGEYARELGRNFPRGDSSLKVACQVLGEPRSIQLSSVQYSEEQ
jgi:hypothetical protein